MAISCNNPKIPLIIDSTLAILREQGEHGLSMRKVASKCGMSLSNLQYYFKNKNELLKGVVSFYFGECGSSFDTKMAEVKAKSPREQIVELINYELDHNETTIESSKTFHQIWAIANTNEEVRAHLKSYYFELSEKLSHFLSPIVIDEDSIPRIVSLLMPYFEGYSITSFTIPLDRGQVAEALVDTIMPMIKE